MWLLINDGIWSNFLMQWVIVACVRRAGSVWWGSKICHMLLLSVKLTADKLLCVEREITVLTGCICSCLNVPSSVSMCPYWSRPQDLQKATKLVVTPCDNQRWSVTLGWGNHVLDGDLYLSAQRHPIGVNVSDTPCLVDLSSLSNRQTQPEVSFHSDVCCYCHYCGHFFC